eukprot:3864912-Amphidinium_carterae.1
METAVQREQFGIVRAEATAQVNSAREFGARSEHELQQETSKLRGELLSTRVEVDKARSDAWKQDRRTQEMTAELDRARALGNALRAEKEAHEAQLRDLFEQLKAERNQREADKQQMMAMLAQQSANVPDRSGEADMMRRLEWQMEQNKQQMVAMITQCASSSAGRAGEGIDGIERLERQMG